MTVNVQILVLEGAFRSSVAVTCDVLSTANRLRLESGRSRLFAMHMSGSGAGKARAFMGVGDTPAAASVVVLPGLGLENEAAIAARFAKRDAAHARQILLDAAERGAAIAASCSGVFLVASAGLLAGRRATTTWWLVPLFQRLYPDVLLEADAVLVTDGLITTGGAAMAQLDLTLAIVARYGGSRLADACARYLLLDQRRSQSRYMAVRYLAAADEKVARAQRWAIGKLDTPFSIGEMAAAVALAPRTFARKVKCATGLTPIQFVQQLRVERALELIETTRTPFEAIAQKVGYADTSTLRRLIHRHTGVSLRALRHT